MCRNVQNSNGIELSVLQQTYFMFTDLGNTLKSSFSTINWKATDTQTSLQVITRILLDSRR
jgi:hypothetical protein